MPRNKYPEETEKKIVDKAFELFVSKGYDNTSVQDIIDETRLSKGAIYHHFDSKESILLAAYDRIADTTSKAMMRIVNDESLNGKEKIQAMFLNSFNDNDHIEFMKLMPNLLDNPRFLALHLRETIEDIAPNFIYPVLEEGIRDGSLGCEHPRETAQVIMALSNVWMNPLIYTDTSEDINVKVEIMYKIMSSLGLEMDDPGFGSSINKVVKERK